jgi:hypothetical protein
MTDARPKQIQEIEGLVAERRKYEQWLAQLDARKESTPSHVFAKVHRDYTARFTEAQQKLSSESGAVHALAAELEESLARQERQIAERTDERAEADLRASVGEYAGKEWEKLRGKLDSAIAGLAGERDSVQRELDTLRALLSEAEPSEDGEPKRDIDDIAFLRSVLGRSTPYSSTPAPVISEPPTGERAPARVSVAAEQRPSIQASAPIAEAEAAPATAPEPVAEREAPSARPAAAAARASSAVPARPSAPELFAMPELPEDPSGPRGSDDLVPNRPSGTFGQLTPRTSEAVKSLKCQECGTLNFPTEWYCERCGGELAAF